MELFAGSGGGILGHHLLGHRTVCAVENDQFRRLDLLQRQNDRILKPFPIWDDIRTFDGFPWRGVVDVVSGGFPCQDISSAGKGAGIEGEKSRLWFEMFRVIREVEPRVVLVENSPRLTGRGLGRVLADLASVGFDAEWGVLGAEDAGGNHIRKRIWIFAYSNLIDGSQRMGFRKANSEAIFLDRNQKRSRHLQFMESIAKHAGSGHGVANRVDRIRAIGDGQVPGVVELAWKILSKEFQI
ncbi:DNA cytosine methyltransferase [Leptospira santarosai]|nr:DNA cytosine methyltransferase [Leptospira santarosai]MDI7219363.1 DNA cytosine methyltransferase [Leptospira santarosai]